MHHVVRHVSSVPNILMPSEFMSCPRILRCMTTLRTPLSAALFVGVISGVQQERKEVRGGVAQLGGEFFEIDLV